LNQPPEPGRKQEERLEGVTETDREVAKDALRELRKRRFPDRAPGTVFDVRLVDMVALCSASVPGDAQAKRQAMSDATANAFACSNGPPTARYIWNTPDHFLAHEARGRRARRDAEAARRRKAIAEAADRERDREWREGARRASGPPPELLRVLGLAQLNEQGKAPSLGHGACRP
jgi:hypothetical protein